MDTVVNSDVEREQQIAALRNLIENGKDASAQFQIMADESYDSPELILFFSEAGNTQWQMVNAFESHLRALGDPAQGSVSRLLARAWRDTASLFGKDASDTRHRLATSRQAVETYLREVEQAAELSWPQDLLRLLDQQHAALSAVRRRIEDLQERLPVLNRLSSN